MTPQERRDMFAAAAMAAVVQAAASPYYEDGVPQDPSDGFSNALELGPAAQCDHANYTYEDLWAGMAVGLADALIAELDRTAKTSEKILDAAADVV